MSKSNEYWRKVGDVKILNLLASRHPELRALPEGEGVYCFFGSDGLCLYVGSSSSSIRGRVLRHIKTAAWRTHIDRVTWEVCSLYGTRETELISKLSPRFNQHRKPKTQKKVNFFFEDGTP